MKRSVISLFILAVFILSVVSIQASSLGIFIEDTTISLHQVCENCTGVNLTSVKFPNGTIRDIDSPMTNLTDSDYNFSFSTTQDLGLYIYNTCGDLNGATTCENIDFTVNKLGEEFTTANSIIYLLLTFFVFFLFVAVLWINIILPFSNQRNQNGNVIMIVKKKYIKIALIPVTFMLFNWFLNLLLNISDKLISGFSVYYNMLSFFLQGSIGMTYPVFIVTLVWFIFNLIRDFNLNQQLKKFNEAFR